MQKKQIIALLCMLFVVGIAVVYLALYKPLVSDIETIKEDLELVELEYSVKQARINTLGSLEQMISENKVQIASIAPNYYGEIPQEELIVKINDLCVKSSVRLLGIQYDGLSGFTVETTEIAENSETTETAETTETSEAADTENAETSETTETSGATETGEIVLYGDIFTVSFIGTYEEILTMLNLIDTNDKKIVNMGLEISKELNTTASIPEELAEAYPDVDFEALVQEDGALSCQISLVFFETEGVEEYVIHDYNILEAEPREKSTSEDPFDVYIDDFIIE